jgi:hypothetical protein
LFIIFFPQSHFREAYSHQIFEPVTCSYPELDKGQIRFSHPHYLKLILLRPPFISRSSKWSQHFGFLQQTPVCMYVCMFFQRMLHSPLILSHFFGSTNHIALQSTKIPLYYLPPLMRRATFIHISNISVFF